MGTLSALSLVSGPSAHPGRARMGDGVDPVDHAPPVYLYRQAAMRIEAMIRSEGRQPGSTLEGEIELAARFGVSLYTMRRAMDELVRAGLVVRKRGIGTQVAASQTPSRPELSSLFEDLLRRGLEPTTQVLAFRHGLPEDEIARILLLPRGVRVYHFTRLRSVGDKPLALMENWVRDDVAELTPERLRRRGMYQILREAGVKLRLANQCIGAKIADGRQAGLLQTTPGSALVTMERTAVDDGGLTVETGRHAHRADSHVFEMTLIQP
jgi:DNA-binding GntR family transcriptional regulator